MDPNRWEFARITGRTWTWQFAKGATSRAFSSLDAATANANNHGFDRFTCSWTATLNGRTTHYRPGRMPLDLLDGMEPPAK